jgi:hypothetical protein
MLISAKVSKWPVAYENRESELTNSHFDSMCYQNWTNFLLKNGFQCIGIRCTDFNEGKHKKTTWGEKELYVLI